MTVFAALVLALLGVLVRAQSGPPFQCTRGAPNYIDCNPCITDEAPVDFLFLIDASPSMQNEINTVRKGLIKFVAEIAKRELSARYAVVLLGNEPELVVDWTDSADFMQSQFSRIRATFSVGGFQTSKGGIEAPLEAMGMALGKKRNSVFDNTNVRRTTRTSTGRIVWRDNAQKFIFYLTDEDSDRPYYSVNRLSGQTSIDPPRGSRFYTSRGWAEELAQTAGWLIDAEAVVYLFMNVQSGASEEQYGYPRCDRSNANFLAFDAAATLQCLSSRGLSRSLQGRLLAADRVARTFDVLQIDEPRFIENFFVAAVDQVSQCERRKRDAWPTSPNNGVEPTYREVRAPLHKRQAGTGPVCEKYTCDVQAGCQVEYTCEPGCINQCKIGSGCYDIGQTNPANQCQYCNPRTSNSAWHECGVTRGNIDQCEKEECVNGKCVTSVPCFPQCGCCCIGGTAAAMSGVCDGLRVDAGQSKEDDPCLICDPIDGAFYEFVPDTKSAACNAAPTCDDEIQNQMEEGVDCGGPCAPCADQCTNGMLDSGEDGIDCGGLCTTECEPCANNRKDDNEEGIDCGPACPGQPCPVADVCGCRNNGACDEVTKECNCIGTGFNGPKCAIPNVVCQPKCVNGGKCRPGGTGCDCVGTGFIGAKCEIPMGANGGPDGMDMMNPGGEMLTGVKKENCPADVLSACSLQCLHGAKTCVCNASQQQVGETVCFTEEEAKQKVDDFKEKMQEIFFAPDPSKATDDDEAGGLPIYAIALIAVGGCLLCVLCLYFAWRMLPDAATESERYGGHHVQMKESDIL